MTDGIDLDRLVELDKARTQGPYDYDDGLLIFGPNGVVVAEVLCWAPRLPRKAIAAYIVAACNALPALVARVRELEAASRWIPSTERPPAVGHAVECCDPGSWNPPYMGDMTMEIAADIRVIDGTGQERWESGADWPFWREIGPLPEVKG